MSERQVKYIKKGRPGRTKKYRMKDVSPHLPLLFYRTDNETLLQRVDWIKRNFDFNNSSIANFLEMTEDGLRQWRANRTVLSDESRGALEKLSSLVLRLLEIFDFDITVAKKFLEEKAPKKEDEEWGEERYPKDYTKWHMPWEGESLREYLTSCGANAVETAELWFQASDVLK